MVGGDGRMKARQVRRHRAIVDVDRAANVDAVGSADARMTEREIVGGDLEGLVDVASLTIKSAIGSDEIEAVDGDVRRRHEEVRTPPGLRAGHDVRGDLAGV